MKYHEFMFWKKKPKFQTPQITDNNFNELVTKSEIPVLIDFYADWCGPCKIMGPIIDELAQEYQEKALIGKVNTEINPALSQHFKIKSIPTIMFIVNGVLVERFQGLIPKPNLAEILDDYIEKTNSQ